MASVGIQMLPGGEIHRQAGELAGAHSLTADDYRRILAVLEAAERAAFGSQFRQTVLAAFDEYLGLRAGAFFIAPPPLPGFRAVDGVLHGYAAKGVDEYVERWSNCEPYACPTAQRLLRSHGIAGLEEFYDRLDSMHRRYVEDFLIPQRIRGHTNLWLETGLPKTGWISILKDSDMPLSVRERATYLTLRPHLAELLRRALLGNGHREAAASLSARELEVAKLVAAGDSNQAIARRLGVTEDTVKKHVSAAMRKMRVSGRASLALTLA